MSECPDCKGEGYQLKELFEKDPDQSLPEITLMPRITDLDGVVWTAKKEAQQDMIKEGWVKVKSA